MGLAEWGSLVGDAVIEKDTVPATANANATAKIRLVVDHWLGVCCLWAIIWWRWPMGHGMGSADPESAPGWLRLTRAFRFGCLNLALSPSARTQWACACRRPPQRESLRHPRLAGPEAEETTRDGRTDGRPTDETARTDDDVRP